MSYRVLKEHGQEASHTVLYSPKAGVGSGVGLFRGMVREQEKTRGEGQAAHMSSMGGSTSWTQQWALKGALAT